MSAKAVSYPFAGFAETEYHDRVDRARRLMAGAGLDLLLITTEANFRYFTGFNSQSWISPTRPMFLVLPLEREPIVIIPSSSQVSMTKGSWVKDLRTWPAPRPADDGVSLLVAALKEAAGPYRKVGAEFGAETQIRMPINDFLRVRQEVAPINFADGTPVLRQLRMVKSSAEIARIRYIAQIVSASFETLPAALAIGMRERDACLGLQLDILQRGADKCPYMTAASGADGYETINTNASDRMLSAGDVLVIDTGSTVDGYFCDFDRNFAFGSPSDAVRRAYDLVYQATDAGIAAAKPGARLSDIWQAMAQLLGTAAVKGSSVGRMGHGLGLNLTEPPSVHPDDNTLIEVGMVLTVEPGIAYETTNGARRVMVHEENLVVTAIGAELLSRRAGAELPVIR